MASETNDEGIEELILAAKRARDGALRPYVPELMSENVGQSRYSESDRSTDSGAPRAQAETRESAMRA